MDRFLNETNKSPRGVFILTPSACVIAGSVPVCLKKVHSPCRMKELGTNFEVAANEGERARLAPERRVPAPNIDYKGWMPFCLILEQCGAPSAEQIDGAHACNPRNRPPPLARVLQHSSSQPFRGSACILVLPPRFVLSLRAAIFPPPQGVPPKCRLDLVLTCAALGRRALFPRWLSQVVMAQLLFRSLSLSFTP